MQTIPLIQAGGLVKIYQVAGLEQVALQGLDLEVAQGEWIALVGPSGAGKSTLLSILAGLDQPSAGRLTVSGCDLLRATAAELTAYRAVQVGVVWQQTTANLLPYLSAHANVTLLLALSGVQQRQAQQRADELLASAWPHTPAAGRCTSPAANNSVWRLPVRSRGVQPSCWATN